MCYICWNLRVLHHLNLFCKYSTFLENKERFLALSLSSAANNIQDIQDRFAVINLEELSPLVLVVQTLSGRCRVQMAWL